MNNQQKVIIAGSRTISDYDFLKSTLKSAKLIDNLNNIEVISGGAKGVDTLARQYAIDNNLKLTEMKPDYNGKNNKFAPLKRNIDMAKYGDILIAIWDGKSTGTNHMINEMRKLGKPTYVVIYSPVL